MLADDRVLSMGTIVVNNKKVVSGDYREHSATLSISLLRVPQDLVSLSIPVVFGFIVLANKQAT